MENLIQKENGTKVQNFFNPQFGNIRIVMNESGEPLFNAKDVCQSLGYTNPRDAIARHCKSDGVVKRDTIDNLGRNQQVNYLSEGNLYRLASKSTLPKSEDFESLIFDEVLPTIRKHGAYATPVTIDAIIKDPEFGITLLSNLKEERQKRVGAEPFYISACNPLNAL